MTMSMMMMTNVMIEHFAHNGDLAPDACSVAYVFTCNLIFRSWVKFSTVLTIEGEHLDELGLANMSQENGSGSLRWVPLESNPEVLNRFMRKLGRAYY